MRARADLSASVARCAVMQKQAATGITLSDVEVAAMREKIKLRRPDAI